MPHLDLTINIPSLLSFAGAAIGLLWKASQFVTEMKAFRADFGEHAERDEERFSRVEARLDALREFRQKT